MKAWARGAALANSEKKNSPQGVATDMQLIDAAPRAHAFIAYAGAGGFDLAESLHALLVPAMYSSVVADADGPPLNGAKEKGGAKAADVWASGADLPMAMCGCVLFVKESMRSSQRCLISWGVPFFLLSGGTVNDTSSSL